ncbi:hypothetical protein MHYP_G00164190 [Metynnis hypsauchen]
MIITELYTVVYHQNHVTRLEAPVIVFPLLHIRAIEPATSRGQRVNISLSGQQRQGSMDEVKGRGLLIGHGMMGCGERHGRRDCGGCDSKS